MDDRRAFWLAIYNIAQILAKRGDFERAKQVLSSVCTNPGRLATAWAACFNVAGLAAVHERVGDVDGPEALYRQAIDLGRSLSIPSYLSGMLVGLAQFLLEQGRAVEARSVYDEALMKPCPLYTPNKL